MIIVARQLVEKCQEHHDLDLKKAYYDCAKNSSLERSGAPPIHYQIIPYWLR